MRVLLATAIGLMAGQPPVPEGGKERATDPVVVSRDAIFLSHPDQNRCKKVGWAEADEEIYEDLLRAAKHAGPSNLLLVRGDDLRAAVAATYPAYNTLFTAGNATGERVLPERKAGSLALVPPRPGRQAGVWAVAYLGSGSDSDWTFHAAERSGTRVRVSFRDNTAAPGGGRVGNVRPNMVWAPLGVLARGRYTLELYETGSREVRLTRVVHVED